MEILNEIFRLCIVPLFAILTAVVCKFILDKSAETKVKISNDIAAKYYDMLVQTVISCVKATNQTYVDELKEKNAFDKEAQLEALEKTREAIMEILSDDAKKCLEEIYGDLPLLVNQLIEYYINLSK